MNDDRGCVAKNTSRIHFSVDDIQTMAKMRKDMKGRISLKDKPVFKRMAVVGFVNEWLKIFVKLNTRRHCLFTKCYHKLDSGFACLPFFAEKPSIKVDFVD